MLIKLIHSCLPYDLRYVGNLLDLDIAENLKSINNVRKEGL
jgi:hypothetical protein